MAVAKFTITGIYCITFGVTPHVISATLNAAVNAGQIVAFYEPGTNGCDFGNGTTYQANVKTTDAAGTLAARSFDVVVN